MIEIWLTQGADKLRLPVLPAEVAVQHAGRAQRFTLQALGEVIMAGKRGLKTLQLDSYFPARYDSKCSYLAIPLPGTAAALIQRWIDEGTTLRLLVTGGAMEVNMPVIIESGTLTEGKAPGEIAYQITLTEYRPFGVRLA